MSKKIALVLFLVLYVVGYTAVPVLGEAYQSEAEDTSSVEQHVTVTDDASDEGKKTEELHQDSSEMSDTEETDAVSSVAESDENAVQPEGSSDTDGDSAGESDENAVQPEGSSETDGDSAGESDENAVQPEGSSDTDGDSAGESDENAVQPEGSSDKEKDSDEINAAPFNSSGYSESGVFVKASAEAGVLPTGTTMHLHDVSSSAAESAATIALGEEVYSAKGVDISFHNAKGEEIEPSGYVQVSIRLPNALDGKNFELIHIPDSGEAEHMGGAAATGASFSADDFSLYVLAGVGTEQDPFSTVYREYTIGFGESVTILSDEKNHEGTWIPGVGNPAWTATDVSGGNVDQLATFQRFRGTADVQPRLIVTGKNKTGTIRVAFRYTHPEDRTHKTLTGAFTATHYYLVHIVDKNKHTYSVQFRNNDGTGISHVTEEGLQFTTQEGVSAQRTISSDYKHTFSVSEDPSTRRGKVTLMMPEYPGSTTRTSGGNTYQFVGWSISASANSTNTNNAFTPIVYPHPDAHIFAPGDKFPLDRDVTLWAVWALQDNMKATFHIRIDDHIPNEPQSHGNASYTQIGSDVNYKIPSAEFKTDAINGIDQGWDPNKRQKPWPAKVFSDLKAAGKLPDDVTTVDEFKDRYRIVWSTIKRENEGWHVDGVLYERPLYNLAYHENGDLVVVSSMPEGVKNIPEGETTLVDKRIPNRYDMVFTGWNTKADGSGVPYIPGSSVVVSEHPELDTEINTLHLYAQWVPATKYTYTVRYLEAGTDRVLKAPVVYGDQILGNKVLSKAESDKATSDIEDYVFSYAHPAIGSGDGGITIGEDNSKNVITLYYMPLEQEILATELNVNKTDEDGAPLEGAEFELAKLDSPEPEVFTSDAEGVVNIPFTEDPASQSGGKLTYTLRESKAPDQYEKSEDVFTIEVRRGDPQVRTFPGGISKTVFPLEATVMKNGNEVNADSIKVINRFVPDPISLPIEAKKILEGRRLKEGEFTFVLMDPEGEQLAETTNTADGAITFDDITAEEAGTYEYRIIEVTGDDREIRYDESIFTVKVKVELGEDKKLKVRDILYEKEGEAVEAAVFTNTFDPTPIPVSIRASKVLEGRQLKEGEFTFVLTDTEGKQLGEATNTADGDIAFQDIIVDGAGTYEYRISEVKGDDKDIQYDESVYTARVKVELGKDNKLTASDVSYEKDGENFKTAVFTNRYAAEEILTITYDLNGGVYKGDESDIIEHYTYGTKIAIHEAPARDGYRFLYWKGSSYQPGDEYTVVDNHLFVAQWEPLDEESETEPDEPVEPEPDEPEETEPDEPEETDEPDRPDKARDTSTSTPPTGDSSDLFSLSILLALSVAGLTAVVLKRRKNVNPDITAGIQRPER